jgi:hypothetical protein
MTGAVRSAKPSRYGGVAARSAAKLSSSLSVSPVGGDGVRAGPALAGQPLGEERLHRRCGRGHWGSPGSGLRLRRRAASASSSGVPVRYQ